jgi:hypothetical protein
MRDSGTHKAIAEDLDVTIQSVVQVAQAIRGDPHPLGLLNEPRPEEA